MTLKVIRPDGKTKLVSDYRYITIELMPMKKADRDYIVIRFRSWYDTTRLKIRLERNENTITFSKTLHEFLSSHKASRLSKIDFKELTISFELEQAITRTIRI